MQKQYKTAVFIGRFQPVHLGHLVVVKKALEVAEDLLILIGSHRRPPSAKNPFSVHERVKLMDTFFTLYDIDLKRINYAFIEDHMYNDAAWCVDVVNAVHSNTYVDDDDICLIGHEKDHSSYYLKMFPQWKSVSVENLGGLNATDLRHILYEGKCNQFTSNLWDYWGKNASAEMLEKTDTETFKKSANEYTFIKSYKDLWKHAPFPPTFITVDALVECSNHVILIQRKANPGKDLFALPGGFIDNGSLLDNCIRELREETKLKVPEPVLKGSVKSSTVFDHPDRSQRGRTVTHCFHFKLRDEMVLPKIKGSDDAKKAEWVPIDKVKGMSPVMFEDHWDVTMKQLGL